MSSLGAGVLSRAPCCAADLHATDIGIVDVLLIQILDDLGDTSKGQQEDVQTPHKAAFLLTAFGGREKLFFREELHAARAMLVQTDSSGWKTVVEGVHVATFIHPLGAGPPVTGRCILVVTITPKIYPTYIVHRDTIP